MRVCSETFLAVYQNGLGACLMPKALATAEFGQEREQALEAGDPIPLDHSKATSHAQLRR